MKRELIIFLIVGSLTVLVDFISYRCLYDYGLMAVDFSKGTGFIIGTIFAYFSNRIWTFGHKKPKNGSIWRFALLYAITLMLNVLINAAALIIFSKLSFGVQLAFLCATSVSAVLNFLGMKFFVFKQLGHA